MASTSRIQNDGGGSRSVPPQRLKPSRVAMSENRAAAATSGLVSSELALCVVMVGMLAVMILPMPAFLLDLLLSLSISLSLVVFLFALHIDKPLQFSSFPSLLLLTALGRLALNVASTRRILLHGNEGTEAAGHVIAAFGEFVVGGNLVVGIIIFIILVVINFVVITKGSGRIAEVAARFTLDSMPGKQMAVDADLAAGVIDEVEAQVRRKAVEQEADFFGAMDGAGKFVRGDAVAGLLITAVNIVGGLIIGVLQQKMPLNVAMTTYTNLTVGDGLITQIPALLTSIAAGLVTTRAAAGAPLGQAVGQQLFGTQHTLNIAGGVLACLALVPGMPHVPFFLLAAAFGYGAYQLPDKGKKAADDAVLTPGRTPESERADIEQSLPLDLLEVEVGYELVPLVDTDRDGALMNRVAGLRKQLAQDLGIMLPPVHMRDNLRLRPGEYRVLLSGQVIGKGELRVGRLLAINPGNAVLNIPGEDVLEPAFGLNARWIETHERQRAEMNELTVVDPATVAATHLGELFTAHAHELVGRREVQELLELHGKRLGKVIEELIPTQLSLTNLVKVLRNLLRERISIRDFRSILEALADHAGEIKDVDLLTEQVRQRLAKQLTAKVRGADNCVSGLVLAPNVESTFRRMQGGNGVVDPGELQHLATAFEEAARSVRGQSDVPILLTSADIRRTVATFSQRYLPQLTVLSFRELDSKANVKTVGVIGKTELRHAV
jgi:flagellar biosynthesis protein FlhA